MCQCACVRSRARVFSVRACLRACVCLRVHACSRWIAIFRSFVRACVHGCMRAVSDTASPVCFVPRIRERIGMMTTGSPPFPFGLWVRRRRLPKMRMNASQSSYRGFPPPEQCELAGDFRGRPDELDEVVEAAVPEAAARSARSCTHAHSSGGAACRGNLNGKRARHSPESPCPCGLRC